MPPCEMEGYLFIPIKRLNSVLWVTSSSGWYKVPTRQNRSVGEALRGFPLQDVTLFKRLIGIRPIHRLNNVFSNRLWLTFFRWLVRQGTAVW
jgi:hypothetical protein